MTRFPAGDRVIEEKSKKTAENSRYTAFLPILLYVLGFMFALAALAWLVASILRHAR